MGKDGHIGSLYPDRKEVLSDDHSKWVLSVDKKSPSSITLSLPVMNTAKQIRVVLVGEDKAEAANIGIMKELEPIKFPVTGVTNAVWYLDNAAASIVKNKVSCIFHTN